MKNIQELYYYTSTNTMYFVLTNGNIYATNLKYMNDGEEYVNGLTELRMVLNDKYDGKADIPEEDYKLAVWEQPKSYSISFSHERDLLSQWSMYAKESGICIRMDFSKDPNKGTKYELPTTRGGKKEISDVFPRKVYYLTKHVMRPKEYKGKCEEIIGDIESGKTEIDTNVLNDIQDGIDTIWRVLAPYVKRKEFFQEAEYRLVFNLSKIESGVPGHVNDDTVKIDYRPDESVLKPYLNVTRQGGWPVKEIIVGPGFNQKAVYDSVRHFLDNASIKIPEYTGGEIRAEGKLFLQRLDEDESIRKSNTEPLGDLWNKRVKNMRDKAKIIQSFNEFIAEQRDKTVRQGSREYVLDYVYMTNRGIILSISETPYIF